MKTAILLLVALMMAASSASGDRHVDTMNVEANEPLTVSIGNRKIVFSMDVAPCQPLGAPCGSVETQTCCPELKCRGSNPGGGRCIACVPLGGECEVYEHSEPCCGNAVCAGRHGGGTCIVRNPSLVVA